MSREVTIEIDDAREVMYDELIDLLGKDAADALLSKQLTEALSAAYDRRESLAQQVGE
jgi:hypothetical protein